MNRRTYIAKNLNYDLSVDTALNCVYLVAKGYWKDASGMEYYMQDIERAVGKLSGGFMFLVDLTDLSGCTPENIKLTIDSQKYIVKAGLSRTAEVVPDNPILRSVAESMSAESKMNTIYFKDRATAERWIELSAESEGR